MVNHHKESDSIFDIVFKKAISGDRLAGFKSRLFYSYNLLAMLLQTHHTQQWSLSYED